MKQVLQNFGSGRTEVADVPAPHCTPGRLLIRTRASLVSTGTERMLVDFGRANLLEKARQQPDKVRMVLEKARTDGLLPTIEAVRHKLDRPMALGYCNVGTVIEVGAGVEGFRPGERVASNGSHAEVVAVPAYLCAKVPQGVSDENAAFTVIGAIALQGIRLVEPTLGESVAVIGAGLVGLATVQLLRAHGCRVLAIDVDQSRLAIAHQFGADTVNIGRGEDPIAAASAFSRGRGMDAAIITASTDSSEPVHQAALICRKRGRIVLVGVTGLTLARADFYEKELSFQVSCSYGPGRYDPEYEEKGRDYPAAFVRWTEQRNFEAVLDMMADGRLDLSSLISHRFPIAEAERAYELLTSEVVSLGILLRYPGADDRPDGVVQQKTLRIAHAAPAGGRIRVAFIGSGNYASGVLIPAFKMAGAQLHVVASNNGASAVHAGRKFRFAEVTTDVQRVLNDPQVDAIVVTTRHDSHAALVRQSLAAGKHVFVEKPLALRTSELAEIQRAYEARDTRGSQPVVMVGFNRRFSPQVQKIKSLLASVKAPKSLVMTVNAGAIPAGHWTKDREVGGGRIIGEACHFIDLLRFLTGYPIEAHRAFGLKNQPDTATIHLEFADGSIGAVHYFANGHKAFAKERLEVFAAGGILQLDNFRRLKGYGWPDFTRMNLWRQDKGQRQCAAAFLRAVENGSAAPIPFDELVEVSQKTIDIGEALA